MTTQNLTGKTVLVTGASRGIGAAIAGAAALLCRCVYVSAVQGR